ncbi:MAG: glycosyltransferase family 4 protein [Cyanobacteria bacterium]|nr:glycosyltransferase family 4 protein [Cyanobacteriota bacterium]MDA0867255.1 glycosyltransferase family 4 protein [Cyanobacteriota bacterium]
MTAQSRQKILVWQPYFMGGGAEAVALWILEALGQDYDVTLQTLSQVSFPWLDAMYYTNLAQKGIKLDIQLKQWMRLPAYFLISQNKILRMALIYWTILALKKKAAEYDVVFSAFNGLDMGKIGIQYLHWVHVVENDYANATPWEKALMKWIDFSHDRLRQNFSIANSQYTADRVQSTYGIPSKVIFPPVTTAIDALPWQEKENAFLCSGRIVQPKQTHRAINILRVVREKGFDVKLYITGGGGGVYAQKYLRKLRKIVRKNQDWVYLYEDLPYKDYLDVLARCRYGIHYKPEPFGISIAEMLKADMIPFVRSKGGQVEIVGSDNKGLLFENEADAVEKIIRVLSDQDAQINMLKTLEQRKMLFSTQHFVEEIQATVKQYLATVERPGDCAQDSVAHASEVQS